jgi:regulator of replication initiation timing
MAYVWQTVEQAAVTLGISTRTIARRIAKGELESRLNSGRREVYICAPDSSVETVEGELTGSDAPQYQAEYEQTVRHTVAASSGDGVDVETSTALILAEDRARRAELAIRVIQESTAIVRDEVRVARSAARWAWGTVAFLSAGVMIAVGWTTASVARSQQQTEALRDRVMMSVEHSDQLVKEQDHLRSELERARTAAARAEGQLQEIRIEAETARAQLAAAREKGPATRPTFGQRLAHVVFSND